MTDSEDRDRLDAEGEWVGEERLDAVRRWVAYIETEPPEVWGRQQNAIVEASLEATREVVQSEVNQQREREGLSETHDVAESAGDGEEGVSR